MFRAWHQAAVNCSKDESASGCATHGCMGVWGVCDECKWVCYTWVCYTWVYGVRQFVNRG